LPSRIEKLDDGKLQVFWSKDGQEQSEVFDTVLVAVGRKPQTANLGLDSIGLLYDTVSGKIPVHNETTNIPHIYALGDVIQGELELTPVAIKAGRLLAKRLYAGSKLFMDYSLIPTTVFTPLEYSCCGMTEEASMQKYGQDGIEVYHTYYTPLESTVTEKGENMCYCKVIVNKNDSERVIGIHILGFSTGEIMQGLAVAMKCGVTKDILDQTVGIHPTSAEELLTLNVTKSSGVEAKKTGC